MPQLLISNLYKSYRQKPVLTGFSAVVPEGKTTCLTGPSGIGKTTLLRILMGLEQPDGGQIIFSSAFAPCGNQAGSPQARQTVRISAVFQEDRLCDSLNPVNNIRLVNPALTRQQIQNELKALGLTACFHQPVRELSGGMRRRVAILRALLAEYDVLFLDEPFRGLDPDTRSLTMDYTRSRCRGKTVLLVTHDPEEAKKMEAEQVLTLS